jgi:uncharacterized protein YaaR (DUF327 family)
MIMLASEEICTFVQAIYEKVDNLVRAVLGDDTMEIGILEHLDHVQTDVRMVDLFRNKSFQVSCKFYCKHRSKLSVS